MNEAETPTPSFRDIEAAVCARFGLTPEILRGPKKHRGIVRPRQIVMFLAREMTPLSYPRIGAHFNRDHTTVLFGERRIKELMQKRPKVADYVKECRALVRPREKEIARELATQPLVIVQAPETQAVRKAGRLAHPPLRTEAETGGGHR